MGGLGTMETMPLTHGRNAREKPGNGTTLAKRQGSPRRSERRSLKASPAVYYLGGLWPLGKPCQCLAALTGCSPAYPLFSFPLKLRSGVLGLVSLSDHIV